MLIHLFPLYLALVYGKSIYVFHLTPWVWQTLPQGPQIHRQLRLLLDSELGGGEEEKNSKEIRNLCGMEMSFLNCDDFVLF